ncbi:MAG: hypothetical protein JOZ24_03035 [Candidatus Eremiobacteraeota bacterium]|nr:hypothetical protein [Candidatus Eremiobacteraeota bacterium]
MRHRLTAAALAAVLGAAAVPSAALADGAASTRNIILGGAAATLLIINHNRKVHQRYAEYERRQAQTSAEASNAEAAYESERSAYAHEAALVQSYQHEVAVQHQEVLSLRHQLAMQQAAQHRRNAQVAAARRAATGPLLADARVDRPTLARAPGPSYGWGAL